MTKSKKSAEIVPVSTAPLAPLATVTIGGRVFRKVESLVLPTLKHPQGMIVIELLGEMRKTADREKNNSDGEVEKVYGPYVLPVLLLEDGTGLNQTVERKYNYVVRAAFRRVLEDNVAAGKTNTGLVYVLETDGFEDMSGGRRRARQSIALLTPETPENT